MSARALSPATGPSTGSLRLLRGGDGWRRGLRIAVLAPPWIMVPPSGYGGIEAGVDLLCEALVTRGHDVTLFAAPGSRSAARVLALLESAHPNTIGEDGLLAADEQEMAGAMDQLGAIDPARCRASVAERYDIAVTTAGYERAYRRVADVGRVSAALAAQDQVNGQRRAQEVSRQSRSPQAFRPPPTTE